MFVSNDGASSFNGTKLKKRIYYRMLPDIFGRAMAGLPGTPIDGPAGRQSSYTIALTRSSISQGAGDADGCDRAVPGCSRGKEFGGSDRYGLARQNGLMAVVAILRDYPSNGVWYLGFTIVDAAARGKDIGRSIYDTIERWAADRGAQEIRLHLVRCRWCRCRSQRPASGRGSDPELGAAPAGRGWWSTSPARPFVPRPPRRRLWQRHCRQGDASPLRPCPRRRASPGHRRSIESAGMTNEQRNAQRRFQRGDATAGGLRADAKVARGAAEPAASRDGQKASKIAPVHGSSISGKSISSIIHS